MTSHKKYTSRSLIAFSTIGLLIALSGYILYHSWNLLKSKEKKEFSIKHLPVIQAAKLNGENLITDSAIFFQDQFVVINFFNTNCEHCQNMAKEMLIHKNELQKLKWLMFTNEPLESVRRFSDSFHLEQLPGVTLLSDTSFAFQKGFGQSQVPSFFVYKKGIIIKQNVGECDINYLLR